MGAGCTKKNQVRNNTIVIQNQQSNLVVSNGPSRKNSVRKLSMVSTRSIRSAIVEAQQDFGNPERKKSWNREIHEKVLQPKTVTFDSNARNRLESTNSQLGKQQVQRRMSVFDRGYKSIKEALMETQMANDLLYKMLPKSIATQLKDKKPVEPQEFEFVSVFFSDIKRLLFLSGYYFCQSEGSCFICTTFFLAEVVNYEFIDFQGMNIGKLQ